VKCPHCGAVIKKRSTPGSESEEAWRARLLLAFPGVDIDGEMAAARRWIILHPGRSLTRRFVENWLHKAMRPELWKVYPPAPPENTWQGIQVGDPEAERRELAALRAKKKKGKT
jgi:hypothetical protein